MDLKRQTRRQFFKTVGAGAAGISLLGHLPGEISAGTIRNGMGYRTLGCTGLEISEVILGAGPITPARGNIVRAAIAQGVNYIDTASSYGKGQSEIAIGEVLKSTGKRDQVIIATKASGLNHKRLKDAPAADVEKAIRERLETSLGRLNTDYVDVYFCPHGAKQVDEVAYPALRETMDKLKKEGKIRFTAISTHTDYANVSMAAVESGYYDVLMPVICAPTMVPKIGEATKAAFTSESGKMKGRPIFDVREVVRKADQADMGIISMKAAKDGFNPMEIHDLVRSEFAKDKDLSFHQIAYKWVLDQPGIDGVNIGMSNMLHLREALQLPETTLQG